MQIEPSLNVKMLKLLLLTSNVSKIKKNGLPNIKFILNVLPENGIILSE